MDPTCSLLSPLRRLALAGVRDALGDGPDDLGELTEPAGDPGLFGPDSHAWKVHGDLGCMLVGGFSALMLQMLHPLAMAGVAQHSSYRSDPLGRLRRTARYVAGTTYGPIPLVEQLADEVRRVHRKVHGVAPDGRPYRADDPDLLAWVHTTEVWGFLAAYQRYSPRPLLRAEKDAYLAEVAVLARLVGATDVPTSLAGVRAYFRSVRPELRATPGALEALGFLRTPVGDALVDGLAHRIVAEAAIDLLPAFARDELGLGGLAGRLATGVLPGSGRLATRAAAGTFAAGLRWAVGPSVVRRLATERATATAPAGAAPARSRAAG